MIIGRGSDRGGHPVRSVYLHGHRHLVVGFAESDSDALLREHDMPGTEDRIGLVTESPLGRFSGGRESVPRAGGRGKGEPALMLKRGLKSPLKAEKR